MLGYYLIIIKAVHMDVLVAQNNSNAHLVPLLDILAVSNVYAKLVFMIQLIKIVYHAQFGV